MLSDLSVTEAASLAIKTLIYGEYVSAQEPTSWREGYSGTFEEYLDETYGPENDRNFDEQEYWEELKYEGRQGTLEGLTAKVEAEYGGEGGGDDYWMVISVTDGLTTRFFRRDGYYASYSGGNLDDETREVKPEVRQVTFYE